MHTHFASGTHALATFLSVLIVGSFWRLAWLRVLGSGQATRRPFLKAIAESALFQF